MGGTFLDAQVSASAVTRGFRSLLSNDDGVCLDSAGGGGASRYGRVDGYGSLPERRLRHAHADDARRDHAHGHARSDRASARAHASQSDVAIHQGPSGRPQQ